MKKHNFSAGPCILPQQVFKEASSSILNFNNLDLSLIEISHRSADFVAVMEEAVQLVKELLEVPAGYSVLFLQGGASMEFLMVANNLMKVGGKAGYLDTGAWSSKAIKEAKLFGDTQILASSKDKNYSYIPKDSVIARMIADLRSWHASDKDWRATRELLAANYGYDKYGGNCHMGPNHGLIIHSLLHGDALRGGEDEQVARVVVATRLVVVHLGRELERGERLVGHRQERRLEANAALAVEVIVLVVELDALQGWNLLLQRLLVLESANESVLPL